jgi:hypothetical protein
MDAADSGFRETATTTVRWYGSREQTKKMVGIPSVWFPCTFGPARLLGPAFSSRAVSYSTRTVALDYVWPSDVSHDASIHTVKDIRDHRECHQKSR